MNALEKKRIREIAQVIRDTCTGRFVEEFILIRNDVIVMICTNGIEYRIGAMDFYDGEPYVYSDKEVTSNAIDE